MGQNLDEEKLNLYPGFGGIFGHSLVVLLVIVWWCFWSSFVGAFGRCLLCLDHRWMVFLIVIWWCFHLLFSSALRCLMVLLVVDWWCFDRCLLVVLIVIFGGTFVVA
ncbi:hypothetical protein C2G38_2227179 [Gigaspora rosea]|uniref:Transmembrane protein n=1 Tax=Gigaspora rosea TaxID=44941 RepID=A0A397TXB8_9GLOM|nr:hypothetical protein C2G38_2227179 [Gigaspora rosea]